MNLLTIQGVRGYIDSKGIAQLNLEDVCRGLGFIQTASSGNQVVRWERVNKYLSDFGFVPTSGDGFIPENIFYRLAMKAKNEIAEKFQIIVADEILPSIRKHGAYMTPETLEKALLSPDFLIQLGQQLKTEQTARFEAEAQSQRLALQIEADKPKVHFAESVEISKDSILVADLAKLMRQKGVEIGEHRLYRWMREEGYLIKSGSEYNRPTQRSMELGLFEVKTGHRGSSDGTIKLTYTSKVTGKGQIYFINKFLPAA